jgi:hypothetical protein
VWGITYPRAHHLGFFKEDFDMSNLVSNFKLSISSNNSGTFDVELFIEINGWDTILIYWLENCTDYESKYGIGIPLDIVCGEDWPNYPLVGFKDKDDKKAFPKKGKTIRARELDSNDKNISHKYMLCIDEEAVDEMTAECLSHLLQLPTTDCIDNIDTLTGQYMGQDVTLSLNDISHEKLCGILDILRKACSDDEVPASY